MKRFPDGVDGKFFFEKHIPSHAPAWVRSVDVGSSDGEDVIPYAMVNDLPTLAWAANLGTIELHVPLWHVGRHRKLPARPDHMVFDLDPGEGTSIVECCVVAGYVMEELAQQGTESFPKTSGSKGLQLYAAVGAADDLGQSAGTRARDGPEIGVRSPGARGLQHAQVVAPGPGLIDWSQNHSAKTTVAVYSVRAMPTPTVSTPVTQAEVERCAAKKDPRILRFETHGRAAAHRQGRGPLRPTRLALTPATVATNAPRRVIHTNSGKPVEDGGLLRCPRPIGSHTQRSMAAGLPPNAR